MYTRKTIQCLQDHRKLTYSVYQVAKQHYGRVCEGIFNIQQCNLHCDSMFTLTLSHTHHTRWNSIPQVYFKLENFFHTTCCKHGPHEESQAIVSEDTAIVQNETSSEGSNPTFSVIDNDSNSYKIKDTLDDSSCSSSYKVNDCESTYSENLMNTPIDERLSDHTGRHVEDSVSQAIVSEDTTILQNKAGFKDSNPTFNVIDNDSNNYKINDTLDDSSCSSSYMVNDCESTHSENLMNTGINERSSDYTGRHVEDLEISEFWERSHFLSNNLSRFGKRTARHHKEKYLEKVQKGQIADVRPFSYCYYLYSNIRSKIDAEVIRFNSAAFPIKKWSDNRAIDSRKDSGFLLDNTSRFEKKITRSHNKKNKEWLQGRNHVKKPANVEEFGTYDYAYTTDVPQTVGKVTKFDASAFLVETEQLNSRPPQAFKEVGEGDELVTKERVQEHHQIQRISDVNAFGTYKYSNSNEVPQAVAKVTNFDVSGFPVKTGHSKLKASGTVREVELLPIRNEMQTYASKGDLPLKVPFPKLQQLAPLVNDSPLLKSLVHVGVDLSKLERKNVAGKVLKLDFNRDVKPVIFFLQDYGVQQDKIGHVLSVFPQVMLMDLDDFKARTRYLQSKKFSQESVGSIIVGNPKFLLMTTKELDSILGFIQRKFFLTGDELRQMVKTFPKILTFDPNELQAKIYLFQDGFGFTEREMKKIVLGCLSLLKIKEHWLIFSFHYLRDEMSITHKQMVESPNVLKRGKHFLSSRHKFLVKHGRAQYNPELPNYVSMKALVDSDDEEFSVEVAKSSLEEFDRFLRTL